MLKVGVVGWPIGHSRSPVIFNHWFEVYGVNARYEPFALPPDKADAFFADVPPEWHGLNITMPHKETAARFVACEGAGERLGVVNTLWREGDAVRATSSDGNGFVAGLDGQAPGWREVDGKVVILGAGGAAASIADALVTAGHSVVIANRTLARAEALAQRVGCAAITTDGISDALAAAALVVNATSLGMEGKEPLSIDLTPLRPLATVADIVYHPLETRLLAAAKVRGHPVVDGLQMLLHQATTGFEKWFGIAPKVDAALRAKVVATL